MKDNIGFIAVGQAGGNIGILFQRAGYKVLCINTSPEDLKTLKEAKHIYHITGGEGCNKDRNKAKDLIIKDFDKLLKKVSQILQEEYINVIFSSGGGTGSGSSPMLIDLLTQNTNKKVGAITILPSFSEPFKTAINAYECFTELERIEDMGATFVLDNNKADKFSINREFVPLFNSLIDIPRHHNFKGNIDIAEIKELLSTRGATIISKMLKKSSDTSQLIKSFKENIFAPMESDSVIKYLGLSASTRIDIDAITREVGIPLDIFQGHNSEHTICILAGLSFPYSALQEIKEKVDSNRDTISKSLTHETRLSDGINFLSDVKNKNKPEKVSAKDIFSKYRNN